MPFSPFLSEMSVETFKTISIVSLFLLALVFALLPKKVQNANPRLLSVLNTFGGGVFLGAGICHLLPEANEGMEHHFHHFPMAFVVAGAGFVTTLAMEEFVHWFSHRKQVTSDDHSTGLLNADSYEVSVDAMAHGHHHHDHDHHHDHEHDEDGHGHSHTAGLTEQGSFLASIVLWVALSFHSVMEGLAIGAQKDKAVNILIAILAHKGIESFALGVSLLRSPAANTNKYYIFLLAFSFMTPIGIGIGMIVEKAVDNALPSLFVSSFAAGTFLYVAICEVILSEFKRPKDKLWKIIALSIGFAFISVLAIFHEHDHDHDDHDH